MVGWQWGVGAFSAARAERKGKKFGQNNKKKNSQTNEKVYKEDGIKDLCVQIEWKRERVYVCHFREIVSWGPLKDLHAC